MLRAAAITVVGALSLGGFGPVVSCEGGGPAIPAKCTPIVTDRRGDVEKLVWSCDRAPREGEATWVCYKRGAGPNDGFDERAFYPRTAGYHTVSCTARYPNVLDGLEEWNGR